jgi:flagellar biogenesis protein FliO
MRTIRALAQAADGGRLWARFPAKKLALGFVLLVAGAAVFTLVDRVAPAAQKAPPAAVKAPVEKPAAGKASVEKPAVEQGAAVEKPAAAKAVEKAAGAPVRKPALAAESPFAAGPLLVMAGMLAGAIGLIFVLKRVLRGSRHVPNGKKILQVRDVLALGPKRAIWLIGLERRNLVIGLSGDELTLLSEYSEEAEAEAAEAPAPAREEPAAELAAEEEAVLSARPAPLTAGAPARIDAVVEEEITVPPPEAPAAPAPAQPDRRARSFPFMTVDAAQRDKKPRTDRVPHKFRQLLEQAAASEGQAR